LATEDIAIGIANTIVSLIPYIIVVVIIIAIIIFIAMRKGKKEEGIERPAIIEPQNVFMDMLKNLLRTQGREIRHASYLKIGPHNICFVKRYMPIYLPKFDIITMKEAKSFKDKKKRKIELIREKIDELQKSKDRKDKTKALRLSITLDKIEKEDMKKDKSFKEDHYILETRNFGFVNRLLYLFGFRINFMIIPKELCNTENSDNFSLPENIYGKPWFDRVYVFSLNGSGYIQDFHDHMTLRQTLKEQINFLPQLHYFDYKTGRFMAKADALRKVKKRQFKDRESQFGGDETAQLEDEEE
jgi:hypothetical protein